MLKCQDHMQGLSTWTDTSPPDSTLLICKMGTVISLSGSSREPGPGKPLGFQQWAGLSLSALRPPLGWAGEASVSQVNTRVAKGLFSPWV